MRLTIVLAVIGGLLIAGVAAVVIFLKSIDLAAHRDLIADAVRQATGRELVLAGEVELAVSMTPTVVVGDVSFANAEWSSSPWMLAVKRVEVEIDLLPLLAGNIDVRRLVLIEPEVLIETDAQGRGNWEFDLPADASATGGDVVIPSIGELIVSGGRASYRDGRSGETHELVLRRLSAHADDMSSPLGIAVTGEYDGHPFTTEGTLGPVAQLTGGAPYAVDLRGEAGGAKIAIRGDIRRALAGEGFDFAIDVQGDTLATLSAFAGRDLPDLGPYAARLRLSDPEGRLEISDLSVELGAKDEIFVAVAGSVGDALAGAGLDLRLTLDAGDTSALADIASIAGISGVPSLGRLAATGRLTDPEGRLAISDLSVELGARDEVFVAVAGSVGDALAGAGLDLRLTLEAHDTSALASIASIAGIAGVPSLGRLAVTGRLTERNGVYVLDAAHATLGDSDVAGRLVVDAAGGRPLIEAEVTSSRLDIDALLAAGPEPAAADGGSTDDDGRVFSDNPLALDMLGAVDGTLSLRGERVVVGGVAFADVALDAVLETGLLTLDLRDAAYDKAKLSGAVAIDVRQPEPRLTAKFMADGLDLGRLLAEAGVTDLVEGAADVVLDLSGDGPSLRAIMAGLDGRSSLVMGEGRIGSGYVDLLAADLVQAFAPWSSDEGYTKVNCFVSRFDVVDGLATSDAMLFDTGRMTVVGKGTVNLASEEIDLIFKPKPKDPSLFSLATPIRLGGTLAKPSASPDTLAVAKKAAGVVLGAIATGGIGLIVPFVSLGSGDDNPCLSAIAEPPPTQGEEGQSQQDQATKDDGGEGLAGVLQGVGGAIDSFLGGN